nr:MAG TPA: hypothetical protein [Caudoviricetes sp.]
MKSRLAAIFPNECAIYYRRYFVLPLMLYLYA